MARELASDMAPVLRSAAEQPENEELQVRDGWYSLA